MAALGLALTAGANNIGWAIAAQAMANGSAAAVIVPVLAVSGGWFAACSLGLATGVVVGGGGLGFIVAGLIIPTFLQLAPVEGWRLAWLGTAAVVVVTAAAVTLLMRDPPQAAVRPPLRQSLKSVYRSAAVWQLGVLFLLYGLAYIIYGTFFAAHLVAARGMPTDEVGRLWALGGVTGTFGGIVAGAASDRLGPRPTLALLFALQGLSVLALAVGEAPIWYLASSLLYGFSVWSFPGVISAAWGAAVGARLAPACVSLAVVLMSIGQMIGPFVGGLMADPGGSFSRSLMVAAGADVVGLVGAIAIRLPREGRRRDVPESGRLPAV